MNRSGNEVYTGYQYSISKTYLSAKPTVIVPTKIKILLICKLFTMQNLEWYFNWSSKHRLFKKQV